MSAQVLGVRSVGQVKADDYRRLGEWFAEHVRHPEQLCATCGVGPQSARA